MISEFSIGILLYLLIAFVLTYAGVELFRRWTLKRAIFDVPNERSSHAKPTPRGGGLIFVAVCLAFYLFYSAIFSSMASWPYLVGAAMIAVISWLDDVKAISVVWRVLVHAISAVMVIGFVGYSKVVHVPFFGEVSFGAIGPVVTFLWIVWLINAYNFMDGIDGIAGIQAVTAGLGWYLLGILWDADSVRFLGGLVAFSSLGFLLHNWPPARIFMGDVGSTFLGFTFGVMPVLAVAEQPAHAAFAPLAGLVFVWFFVFDTLATIVIRLLRRKRVWHAHREHMYQRLVISGMSHRAVTLLYGLVAVLAATFLFPAITLQGKYDVVSLIVIIASSIAVSAVAFTRRPVH